MTKEKTTGLLTGLLKKEQLPSNIKKHNRKVDRELAMQKTAKDKAMKKLAGEHAIIEDAFRKGLISQRTIIGMKHNDLLIVAKELLRQDAQEIALQSKAGKRFAKKRKKVLKRQAAPSKAEII